ncbi:sodium:solute symporter [Pantoea sp. Bo_2]|uniref:Sodium:solute symporter n=1 Tax=Candidatus Pantoea gossypiicola TaxID=2608008 RepID=A0AB34CDI1_9GAMM|nr:sodium:solute symporter [Pantoea sp. VH_8]KAA5929171.1 sodium:solute symporter [Pantoea sp. VH_4]KAA5975541.1 sodium:solute symporter [Pantoea sp. M_3]KAA5980139.1 sodium:solute symporter [Pantoea sp. M_4]KAA6038661.1 sodium:solute symporter [Pantoea sp. FN_2b]KAA6044155.1 sodium:solute symporter [Pantoea sp. Bo_5]KAA6052803.1 sodium:solute symporter [Pantoea sp. Bo_40]KAA6053133.1 sodium:solute symporter [Pantoea sp. Bo_46]KAA6056807.1 sodium:solute symporter [Pantoea sp. Bo_3]KAA60666
MKKVSELALLTLFFSSLAGMGLTTGFYCFFAVCDLLRRMIG